MTKSIKEVLSERENIKLGHPCKLFSIDKRKIVLSITTRKAENTVQAIHLINSALPSFFSAQTIHNVLKATSLKIIIKKKMFFFFFFFFSCQAQKLKFGGLDQSYLV